MPEWLVERGIGESRWALVDDGDIIEARVELDGLVPAGSVIHARLVSVGARNRNSVARSEDGTEYLLPYGAGSANEGSSLLLEVTRSKIPGSEPWKRPLGRVIDSVPEARARDPDFPARILVPNSPTDELGDAGWGDIIEEARSGVINFDGGQLRVALTPAMTLIDVDGYLEADELAIAGARAAARVVRRLDIGGSIGIDLPTVSNKSVRQAAGRILDECLPPPFERTAMNGFGFAQVVRPRTRASLIELAADRVSFEARALLRHAVRSTPGSKTIVGHPAVIRALEQQQEWLRQLSMQVGGEVGLRADEGVTIVGGYVG